MAHSFGGDHAEGFAVDGGVDDAAAIGVEGVAHGCGDSSAVVDIESEVFGDMSEDVAVALSEAGSAADDELDVDAAVLEDFGGVEEQVDAFFGVLSADVGDDGEIAAEVGEFGFEDVEGWGIGGVGQIDAGVDGSEAGGVDAHFMV